LKIHILRLYRFLYSTRLYHLLFWLLYILLWALLFQPSDSFGVALLKSAAVLSFHAGVSYFNNYYLVDWFLMKRRYLTYLFTLLLIIGLACFPLAIIYHRFFNLGDEVRDSIWTWRFFLANGVSILLTVAITTSLKLLKSWYQEERLSQSLQRVSAQTELKFLKAQINPHFLFNSLNSLYALTLMKSDHAPEVVLRLSNILRYVLYETTAGKVALGKEVEYLRDYIELERIRLGERAKIEEVFEVKYPDAEIEPMIFLTLVENSFKHGASRQESGAWVRIGLTQPAPDSIEFEIANSKGPVGEANAAYPNTGSGGIGLENLLKRLQLLYKDRHTFLVSETAADYTVKLTLKL
jgi:two-component system, LytTR family, sensor kinase